MKHCISCGMPMQKASDFTLEDETKEYCRYCANTDGTMQTFEQKKASYTNFFIKTQNIEESIAEKLALDAMSKLPAWKSHF